MNQYKGNLKEKYLPFNVRWQKHCVLWEIENLCSSLVILCPVHGVYLRVSNMPKILGKKDWKLKDLGIVE